MSARSCLVGMLEWMRPAGSAAEWAWIQRYILPVQGAELDMHGNIHVIRPMADGTPSRVLWSCHTDTVHKEQGQQTVAYNPADGTISLAAGSTANCLGADDTVGVWLCLEMLRAGVPGHYVFHYGEERGGIGSRAVVAAEPERFAGIDFAIALDRQGTADVITEQAGGRCCSDVFAWSLAAVIGGDYKPCDTGIYTDTAEYTGIVPECTNLSVGYYCQHTAKEWIDVGHALALRQALCRFDETLLVADPDNARDAYEDILPRDIGWRDYGPAIDVDYLTEEEYEALRPMWAQDDPASREYDDDDDGWDYGGFAQGHTLTEDDKRYLRLEGWAIRKRKGASARLH